jgi:hypothetical protein
MCLETPRHILTLPIINYVSCYAHFGCVVDINGLKNVHNETQKSTMSSMTLCLYIILLFLKTDCAKDTQGTKKKQAILLYYSLAVSILFAYLTSFVGRESAVHDNVAWNVFNVQFFNNLCANWGYAKRGYTFLRGWVLGTHPLSLSFSLRKGILVQAKNGDQQF